MNPGAGNSRPDPVFTLKVVSLSRSVPTSTGFSYISGQVDYIGKLKRIRIQIIFSPSPRNLGPVPYVREEEDWPTGKKDTRGMRKRLEEIMSYQVDSLLSKKFPKRGFFLEQCNVQQAEDFLLTTCSKCHCPYCELVTT